MEMLEEICLPATHVVVEVVLVVLVLIALVPELLLVLVVLLNLTAINLRSRMKKKFTTLISAFRSFDKNGEFLFRTILGGFFVTVS